MERVTLYRAVSEEEFQQLVMTGTFETVPHALEGKFFAEHPEHAAMWGEALTRGGAYRIVEVELLARVAAGMLRWERLDGIGPARYAALSQLQDVTVRLYPS
jgi:hypothetical protein